MRLGHFSLSGKIPLANREIRVEEKIKKLFDGMYSDIITPGALSKFLEKINCRCPAIHLDWLVGEKYFHSHFGEKSERIKARRRNFS